MIGVDDDHADYADSDLSISQVPRPTLCSDFQSGNLTTYHLAMAYQEELGHQHDECDNHDNMI